MRACLLPLLFRSFRAWVSTCVRFSGTLPDACRLWVRLPFAVAAAATTWNTTCSFPACRLLPEQMQIPAPRCLPVQNLQTAWVAWVHALPLSGTFLFYLRTPQFLTCWNLGTYSHRSGLGACSTCHLTSDYTVLYQTFLRALPLPFLTATLFSDSYLPSACCTRFCLFFSCFMIIDSGSTRVPGFPGGTPFVFSHRFRYLYLPFLHSVLDFPMLVSDACLQVHVLPGTCLLPPEQSALPGISLPRYTCSGSWVFRFCATTS